MKKLILSLGFVAMAACAAKAQDKNKAVAAAPVAAATTEAIQFKEDSHNFGTVAEGAPADYEFTFKNTSKEPVIIQKVQPSCGCTTPSYSKEPVAPGKTGTVKASYGTLGRPGEFHKTLTVMYNVGSSTDTKTKVLTINGSVDKAPTTSVPENSSMMKTN